MSLPRKANGPPALLLEPRFDSIPSDPPSVLLIGCGAVGSVVAQHLCAMGEDPGLSNVFARYAADGMERVDSIKVRDGDTASSPDYPFIALFSPETFVEETLAPSRIWRDGKYDSVPPFGELEAYEFPAPIGSLPVYSVDREAAQLFGATATAYLTGTGAAAGALLLASGSIREKGKLSPENLDPKPFFPLLRRFGIDVKERVRSERSLA